MKRIDNATATASLPAYSAGANPNRYFTDGTPGVTDGTTPGQDWFNMVQEELANAITDDGDTLDGADDTQLAQRLTPLKAIITSATDTGTDSTTHLRAIVASATCKASGSASGTLGSSGTDVTGAVTGAIGSEACVVSGTMSAVAGSDSSTVSGDRSFAGASLSTTVSGDMAAALATRACTVSKDTSAAIASGVASGGVVVDKANSAAIASVRSKIAESFDAQGSLLLAGVRCELATDGIVASGYHVDTTPTYNGTNQNLTFKLVVATGEVTADGSFTGGGADYAEYFEAADHSDPPPVGSIVALDGTRVRLAQLGDRVLGVVSAAPAVAGNAAALSWSGRFLLDEWGRRVTREYPDGQVWYVEAPEYDPSAPYVPRQERPEWVPVGLLGQIRVRVDGTVTVGCDVMPGAGGVGTAGVGRGRPVVCMALTAPGVALCLVG